jgi:hypothetical protein
VRNILKTFLILFVFTVLCRKASADISYDVTLDTAPLIGHPAGPFSILFIFIDGSGVGDANNTVTISNVGFGGGSALGNPVTFGGASGSLETEVTITDSSFLSLFNEGFSPGPQLSFSLDLTSNNDANGIPDRLTFSILDGSGVPLPTLAPYGDYFLESIWVPPVRSSMRGGVTRRVRLRLAIPCPSVRRRLAPPPSRRWYTL